MKYRDKNGHTIKSGDTVYFEPIKCNCLINENVTDDLIIIGRFYRFAMTHERASQMTIITDGAN